MKTIDIEIPHKLKPNSVDLTNGGSTPAHKLGFIPNNAGDIEIFKGECVVATIPKSELPKVSEFLFSQSPEIRAEMAAGRENKTN